MSMFPSISTVNFCTLNNHVESMAKKFFYWSQSGAEKKNKRLVAWEFKEVRNWVGFDVNIIFFPIALTMLPQHTTQSIDICNLDIPHAFILYTL